jgi:hypothetical protein
MPSINFIFDAQHIMRIVLIFSLLFTTFIAQAQTCNCAADFAFLEAAYKTDYAGMPDFIHRHPNYNETFAHIKQQSKKTNDVARCDELIKQLITYLNNGHVSYGKTMKNPLYKKTVSPLTTPSYKPTLQFIDSKTVKIEIKTCELDYKPMLDSLVYANKEKLDKTEHFIIDLRGNEGGGDAMFDTLIPYLYTNPILCYSADLWASPNNVKMFANFLTNPNLPADTKAVVEKIVVAGTERPNTFVPMSNNKVDTILFEAPMPYPKKVSVLIDRKSASATEQFLLLAKQSKKVTIYGHENSAGALDYANVNVILTPSGYWYAGIPTTRSNRLPKNPVDPMGIKPDVVVDKSVKDLIDYVLKK